MVVGAFPTVKLAALLMKQISKPIANFAKERAKNNTFFRTYVCMPPAQFYNWCEVKSKMWIMNLGKPVNIPQLNEQMAIELGANLLGEGIIYILGAALLIVEYNRSSKKEAAKEEERKSEIDYLQSTIKELYFTVQTQSTQINSLQRTVGELETKAVLKPWVSKKDSKDSDEPPPPSPPNAAPNSHPILTKTNIEERDELNNKNSLPYPNTNIVMKSLNFIQLDLFNSAPVNNDSEPDKNVLILKLENPSNLLDNAISYLQKNIKGVL